MMHKILHDFVGRTIAAMAVALAISFVPSAFAKTIYVSPDGTGDGATEQNPAALSSTLLLGLGKGDIALAAAGDYTLTETLSMTNSVGKPITLQGSGATTVFRYAEGFKDVAFNVASGTLSKLWLADSQNIASNAMAVSSGMITECVLTNLTTGATGHSWLINATGTARIEKTCMIDTKANAAIRGGNGTFVAVDCTVLRFTSISPIETNHGGVIAGGKAIRCKFLSINNAGNHSAFLSAEFYDCLFDGVVSSYHIFRNPTAYNCTIRGNVGDIWPEGKYYNCIFFGNKTSRGGPLDFGSRPLLNCFLEPDIIGGNRSNCVIGDDPMLNDDSTLQTGSPCIDVGIVDSTTFPTAMEGERTIDLFGNPRQSFNTIDIGCAEKNGYADGEKFFNLNQVTVSGFSGEEFAIEGQYRADAGVLITIDLNYGDGTNEHLELTAVGGNNHQVFNRTHTYAVGGRYTLSVTVAYDAQPGEKIVITDKFLVQNATEGDVFVSPAGNDLNDGLARDRAKATVESAAVAVRNGKILLLNGKHEMSGGVVVTTAQIIEGESRDGVVVTTKADNTLFTVNNVSAKIRNLTFCCITNNAITVDLNSGSVDSVTFDAVDTGSLACIKSGYGANRNCIITNCLFKACAGGAIIGCEDTDSYATVVDTVFDGCTAKYKLVQGHTKYRLKVIGCSVERYLFLQGGALYDCLISGLLSGNLCYRTDSYNCTFVCNNAATTFNGGKHYNDIIVGNTKNVVTVGEFYNCLYDDEALTAFAKDGKCIYSANARLTADFIPRNSSPAVGAARYRDDSGESIDATYFPNPKSLRSIDLAGKPRVRNREGAWLDLGCFQAPSPSGFMVILR